MSTWRRSMDAWLAGHLGIINAATLHRLGCTERNVACLVARGELITVMPGVFCSAQWPFGRPQMLGAVCARNPAALIGFTTAGQAWGMRKMKDGRVHVLVPHGCSPELEGVVVHRCRRIDPVDIVVQDSGLRLTSPPRTLFDTADMLGAGDSLSVLEQLLDEQRVTLGTVMDTFERLYHPRRPGSTTMRAVIRSRAEWRAALQSDLEVRVLAEIERQRLPPARSQFRIDLPNGRHVVVDFGWPEVKLAVEVDHPAWHAGSLSSHADKTRDRKLATIGWTTTRITDIDVNGGLRDAVDDVATILRRLRRAA
jgi:very-short-patch-repair endonuclease